MTYPTRALYEEVGYVAWHLHWPMSEILDLEHAMRHEMVDVIGDLAEQNVGA